MSGLMCDCPATSRQRQSMSNSLLPSEVKMAEPITWHATNTRRRSKVSTEAWTWPKNQQEEEEEEEEEEAAEVQNKQRLD